MVLEASYLWWLHHLWQLNDTKCDMLLKANKYLLFIYRQKFFLFWVTLLGLSFCWTAPLERRAVSFEPLEIITFIIYIKQMFLFFISSKNHNTPWDIKTLLFGIKLLRDQRILSTGKLLALCLVVCNTLMRFYTQLRI